MSLRAKEDFVETEKVIEALEKAMQKGTPIVQSAFEELVAKTGFSGALWFWVSLFLCLLGFTLLILSVYAGIKDKSGNWGFGVFCGFVFFFIFFCITLSNAERWLYPKAYVIEQIINRVQ